MSNLAQGWAWQQKTVRGLAKFTLIALADHSDDEGICWPGRKGLAEKMGISERTVTEHIATLINLGLLESMERFRKDGSQTSNFYRLAMIPLAKSSMGGATFARPLELVASGGANLATLEPSLEPLKETSKESDKENIYIEAIEVLREIKQWDRSKEKKVIAELTKAHTPAVRALKTARDLASKWAKTSYTIPYLTFLNWVDSGLKPLVANEQAGESSLDRYAREQRESRIQPEELQESMPL